MQLKNLRLLIVNPYGIGDALFCTPLIRSLKKKFPDAFLGLLLGGRTAELFKYNPDIDIILDYNKDSLKTPLQKGIFVFGLSKRIRKFSFDVLIDLSLTDEYAFFGKFFWNIPHRIGFRYKNRGRFLNHSYPYPNDTFHIAKRYGKLLDYFKIQEDKLDKKLYFYKSPSEEKWLETFLTQYGLKKTPLVLLLPGGGESWGGKATYKYWPSVYYAELIQKLLTTWEDVRCLLIGGTHDKFICNEIFENLAHFKEKCLDISGKTSLQQLAHLMSVSRLVMGTESGPLHMANALGCRAISIFGPVDSHIYGPYDKGEFHTTLKHSLPCQPCYQNFRIPECDNRLCLKELTPHFVFERVSLLINSSSNVMLNCHKLSS